METVAKVGHEEVAYGSLNPKGTKKNSQERRVREERGLGSGMGWERC